jgi:hypothetical protein
VCFGLLNDSIFYIIFWHSLSYRLLFKTVRLIGDFPPFSGTSRGEFGVKNEKRLPNQVWEPFSAKFDYADGGTRTRTALSGQRILSPLRLPFRHIGARAEANEAAHRCTGKRNFDVRIRRARSLERPDSGQSI